MPRPGGSPLAANEEGEFELAAVLVNVKGCPRKATAVTGLVMVSGTGAAFVGYRRFEGITCFDWLGLYQERCVAALLPAFELKYSRRMLYRTPPCNVIFPTKLPIP